MMFWSNTEGLATVWLIVPLGEKIKSLSRLGSFFLHIEVGHCNSLRPCDLVTKWLDKKSARVSVILLNFLGTINHIYRQLWGEIYLKCVIIFSFEIYFWILIRLLANWLAESNSGCVVSYVIALPQIAYWRPITWVIMGVQVRYGEHWVKIHR